jgi:hypothetical protein
MSYVVWFLRIGMPLAAASIIVAALRTPQPEGLPNGFRKKALALELPQKVEDIEAIKKVYPEKDIRKDIKGDFLFVIPLYTSFFMGLGFVLYSVNFPYAKVLGLSLCLCALLAAIFDILENQRMLGLLTTATQADVDATRHISLVKWFAFGLMMFILGIAFVLSRQWAIVALGILYFVAGVLFLIGLWQNTQVEKATTLMIVAWLLTGEAIHTIASKFSP